MEVTLESVKKNKAIYDKNIKKIFQDRAELMKQVTELRRKRDTLINEIDIAKLDFEEAKLVQQINDMTFVFKGNKLTLEQLGLQQDILEENITKETYSNSMVANRKAKANLSKEQELAYCEDEVEKCKKALRIYTLMGDTQNIGKWEKDLEAAQKSLKYAQTEIAKSKPAEKREATSSAREDNIQKEEISTRQKGYTVEKNNQVYIEQQHQVLKEYSGKEIGNRTITWTTDIEKGTEDIETISMLENEDGKYSMKEVSKGVGGEIQLQRKEFSKDNKVTGEKEQFVYQKDDKGNEMYYRTVNGKLTYKITKTSKGVIIDSYDQGQLVSTFEYDKDGKAIDGLPGIDELDEGYIENIFDSQVPYFEPENREIQTPDVVGVENGQTILDSAIEATEIITRTSTIDREVHNMENLKREKTQQQTKQNNGVNR